MKQLFKKRMAQVMAVLLAISTVTCFIPQTAAQAYAESNDPVVGLPGVLETGANTDSAQTVYYGVNGNKPIAWRVIKYKTTGNAYIENQDGSMTLFAADNLTSGVQFATNEKNEYAGSNLKSVVDGLYGSLFSTKEQSAIKSRTLGVAGYTDVKPYSTGISGNQTSGYLWPLSTAEALALPSNTFRIADDYWWLCSPGLYDYYAARVRPDGDVDGIGGGVGNAYGVRPAFNLNLSSVLFTSAAEGGKSSGAAGDGSLELVSANSTGEWKLTVHDSSRDVFKASAATDAVLSAEEGYTSWNVSIACKAEGDDPNSITPVPTEKDYVSVILADSEDNALYYGSIAKASNSGTKNVTIPTGLAAGEYKLHVFYEEINGDKLTDYSSAFRTIDLTVNPRTYAVTAPAGKTFTYNGKAQTGVASGADYTLSGTVKATNAGSYTAKAALKINDNYTYKWSDGTTAAKTIKWTINKAANTLKIKAKTATVKGSTKGKKGTLKKTKKLAVTKVIKFTSKGQGAKTYVKKSGNKKITIAKKTGKVTVKKGLKKGTYKVKVKVKAAGNANYKASKVKTVTFKVIVK